MEYTHRDDKFGNCQRLQKEDVDKKENSAERKDDENEGEKGDLKENERRKRRNEGRGGTSSISHKLSQVAV
jgi:hypothetical protein